MRRGMNMKSLWESQREINHWENLYEGEKIILKWILEK
jgi:hypothetical protein